MPKTTILVETKTRESLKRIGNKGQTYDQIINELIKLKGRQMFDGGVEGLSLNKSSASTGVLL